MKRGLLLTTLLAAGLLLSLLSWWPFESRPDRDGRAHLDHLRSSGLLAGARAQTRLGEVRRIVPVATRWSAPGEPFWWAELNGPDGSAGYLAWRESGDRALLDFSLEGLVAIDLPQAQALGGVPAIQQFPLQGADGQAVASGCVPTAGASLIAYWSNRGTFDWQADDSHEGLVRRVRDRLPMSVIADVEGYADGKMALAGCFPGSLAVGLQEDADQYRIPVRVTVAPFRSETLAEELAAGDIGTAYYYMLTARRARDWFELRMTQEQRDYVFSRLILFEASMTYSEGRRPDDAAPKLDAWGEANVAPF